MKKYVSGTIQIGHLGRRQRHELKSTGQELSGQPGHLLTKRAIACYNERCRIQRRDGTDAIQHSLTLDQRADQQNHGLVWRQAELNTAT